MHNVTIISLRSEILPSQKRMESITQSSEEEPLAGKIHLEEGKIHGKNIGNAFNPFFLREKEVEYQKFPSPGGSRGVEGAAGQEQTKGNQETILTGSSGTVIGLSEESFRGRGSRERPSENHRARKPSATARGRGDSTETPQTQRTFRKFGPGRILCNI